MAKPKFTTDFPGAVIREGADELTLRAKEEGARRTFIDTSKMEKQRWGPLLVDADWHAVCQAYQGIEGPEWEAMYYHYEDLHQAPNPPELVGKTPKKPTGLPWKKRWSAWN